MRRNGFAAANGIHPLIGLSLDADAGWVDGERPGDCRSHRVDVIPDLRRLEEHGGVDVADLITALPGERRRPRQQIEAGGVLPGVVAIWKMTADVSQSDGAQHRVGDRMTDDIRVRVSERVE